MKKSYRNKPVKAQRQQQRRNKRQRQALAYG